MKKHSKMISPIKRERHNPIEKLIDHYADELVRIFKIMYAKDWVSDKMFLSWMHRLRLGFWVNWKNPRTFGEKLQWLKLYNRQDLYTTIVDKVKFKEWAAERIGSEYIIPNYGVWDSPDEIEFDKLPATFVLKNNHASGEHYLHTSADAPVDRERALRILKSRFYIRWDKSSGEWPYRNVKHKVLAEELLVDDTRKELLDYKFYCFHGEPQVVQVFSWPDHYKFDTKKDVEDWNMMYDMNWKKLPFIHGYPYKMDGEVPRPENFEAMIDIARKLSKDIPFVKVDLYNIKGKIYVGEMTFFPYGGFGAITPDDEWEYKLGDMIHLDQIKNVTK